MSTIEWTNFYLAVQFVHCMCMVCVCVCVWYTVQFTHSGLLVYILAPVSHSLLQTPEDG